MDMNDHQKSVQNRNYKKFNLKSDSGSKIGPFLPSRSDFVTLARIKKG